jgi:hypothetical protein
MELGLKEHAMDDDRQVLIDQLNETLDEGAEEWDDALEIATLAGQIARKGERGGALLRAELWRDGPGRPLVDELWDEIDVDGIVAAIEDAAAAGGTEEDLEEAVYDLDDLVAAAVWLGSPARVADASERVASLVADRPDSFAFLVDEAADLCRLPEVANQEAAYAFWFAILRIEEEE